MEKHTLHVSIIGGGIAGLAAACALQRQGIQVTVFERNPELREIGAGLTLWANGVQVLRHPDLGDALTAVSARLTHFECWSWRGKRLRSMRLDTIEQRVGAASLGIHRADLLRRLSGVVDRGSIHVYAHCVGFSEEPGHVIARFADEHEQQTDLLVGADGLYTVIREQLLGKAPSRYSGSTRFSGGRPLRGCARLSGHFQRDMGGEVGALACCQLATGGCSGTPRSGFPAGEQDYAGERKARLSRLFGGWREPIGRLIEATDEEAILRNDLFDRQPVRNSGRGRVTQLGDAAHPPTPNLGQGACQALEDALVLVGCLAEQREPVAALRAYEARRRKLSAAIIKQSALVGTIGQWEPPLLCSPSRRCSPDCSSQM